MSAIPKIAFLGTGMMGLPMARNILKAGFPVTAWNRTPAKASEFEGHGGAIAATAADAVADADIVISIVSDGPAVADILFSHRVAEGMKAGAVFCDMSSIKPSQAREHAARLAEIGIAALDAPVSGGTKGAEAGTLAIMAGGPVDAFATAEPVLRAMGRPTHVGPTGCGQIAKLANQGIVAVTIGAVAEAMMLAEKSGLKRGALRQALAGGFADSVILQQHGERMELRNFVPGGKSVFQLKDLDNLLEVAREGELLLPLAELQAARFERLVKELDGGELDHAALFAELLDRQERTAG